MTSLVDLPGKSSYPAIELTAVERRYGERTVALAGVSVAFQPGDVVAIVGPSGSGKSTLLGILGLLDSPSSGSYRFAGVATESMTSNQLTSLRAQKLAYIFQAFHLIPHLTAVENTELSLTLAGVPKQERRDRALSALDLVGLSHRAFASPPTMSGGEQQRLAVARAIVRRPELLLCDEPTGNLDTENSRIVLDLILSTHNAYRVTVIVTHDSAVAARCTRIIRVVDGQIVSDDSGNANA
ncbi:MAG: ABC transporter ATP-binding protein [Microbacteriaceae bacterium]